MVFYMERKRRRPEENSKAAECHLFECGSDRNGEERRLVRLISKPPEFNLTQPPDPFDMLGTSTTLDENSREKFLLYYLNHDSLLLAASSSGRGQHTTPAAAAAAASLDHHIRDRCNNLKIQLLASIAASNDEHQQQQQHKSQSSGAGYNYIRSKIIVPASSSSSNHETHFDANHSSNLTKLSSPGGDKNISFRPTLHTSSNLFSSFLYSFSILFLLFIFVFFIYLYYSR